MKACPVALGKTHSHNENFELASHWQKTQQIHYSSDCKILGAGTIWDCFNYYYLIIYIIILIINYLYNYI